MKAALAINCVTADTQKNIARILRMIDEAAQAGVELVLFPEAAPTGLINNDDPAHDLPLGQEVPGPTTRVLARYAQDRNIWVAIGLLERQQNRLYDTAILLAPDGKIKLKYRRIQPQWHGRHANPAVYCQGSELGKVETPFGSFAFLICGDLFDDTLVGRVRKLQADWLLLPFARCFNDGSYDQQQWDREEKDHYIDRVKLSGTPTLMTNYLAERNLQGGAFGGAMVVDPSGQVKASFPLGKTGLLAVDL